jgi:hypothetical protein
MVGNRLNGFPSAKIGCVTWLKPGANEIEFPKLEQLVCMSDDLLYG